MSEPRPDQHAVVPPCARHLTHREGVGDKVVPWAAARARIRADLGVGALEHLTRHKQG